MPYPGDVYWLHADPTADAAPRIPHPHVVIAADADAGTVVVCALTTNMTKLGMPGNVLLDEGEAGLPKRSIVEVSKNATIPARRLGAYVGALSAARVGQIRAGMQFVERSFRS